ncbi:MAG: GNAT family N-acetyltransferase [Bacilli bacterium]
MNNFRKITLNDDFNEISSTLLLSDLENYPLLFKEDKKKDIFNALLKESKYFSYKNVYGYFTDEGKMVASMMYFTKKTIFDEDKIKEILLRFDSYDENIFTSIKDGYFIKLLNFHEDIYIYNLAVNEQYQSQGYGKKLLSNFINKYKNHSISLECLKHNEKAFHLYESLSFKPLYSFKTYTYFESNYMSYHMVYSLKKENNLKINKSKIIICSLFIFILLVILILILVLYLL